MFDKSFLNEKSDIRVREKTINYIIDIADELIIFPKHSKECQDYPIPIIFRIKGKHYKLCTMLDYYQHYKIEKDRIKSISKDNVIIHLKRALLNKK